MPTASGPLAPLHGRLARRAAGGLLAVVLLAGCGGGSKPAATGQTAGVSTTAAAAGAPRVDVTSFGPSGSNVEVDVQVTNPSSAEVRFLWPQLVLTAPDGAAHTAYRDPAAAPYETVGPGGSFVGGGVFQFPAFVSGRYKLSYAGRVLAEKTL